MIRFNIEGSLKFKLKNKSKIVKWIKETLKNEDFLLGDINYIFCDDMYLNSINSEFLNHDDFTDVISFDYTEQKKVSGDIFISIDRINENADIFNVETDKELYRVMIHGILHFMGYKDKNEEDKKIMREKEEFYLKKIL